MSDDGTFLKEAKQHLQAFAERAGVSADSVFTRVTLADGSLYIVKGSRVAAAPGANGWGLIEGIGADEVEALVVHSTRVFKVEFALTPEPQSPVGLHTEAASL